MENNLLSNEQHGFVPNKSCSTNLLECQDIITSAVNSGHSVDVIYTDFSKAFDKVSHKKLIKKLKNLKVNPKIVHWISSFLDGRKQKVVLGDIESDWEPVSSGVPQGSVLGPLLFVVYINDLPAILKNDCRLYADDSKIISVVDTNELEVNSLQEDLFELAKWCLKWSMELNIDKCKVMHIGKQNPKRQYWVPTAEGGKKFLGETSCERDLGIIVSDDLEYEKQVEYSVAKANKMLGIVRRTFVNYDSRIAKLTYTTFIRPHLEYAVSTWNPKKQREISLIERVQHRATKASDISELNYESRLNILGLTNLKERRRRGDLIQCYKIINGIDKVKLIGDCFRDNNNSRELRSTVDRTSIIRENKGPSKARFNFFTNRVATAWNQLPNNVVNGPSVNSFKSRLDHHMKSQAWRTSIYQT